jgi:hypothetical protein
MKGWLLQTHTEVVATPASTTVAAATSGAGATTAQPFTNGLFGTPQIATGAALEVSTPFALVAYAAMGWLVARGAWLMFGETRSSSVASSTSNQTQVG